MKYYNLFIKFIFLGLSTLDFSVYSMSKESLKDNDHLIRLLCQRDIIKYGDFLLKNGSHSPIYIDMRMSYGDPHFLKLLAGLIGSSCSQPYDYVCGVPYGAVPLATAIALQQNKPLLMVRKEQKKYGTAKLVEGDFSKGCRVLVVEDVTTSGSSIKETINVLENAGLLIAHIGVIIDRQEPGLATLQKDEYNAHALLTLREIQHYKSKL